MNWNILVIYFLVKLIMINLVVVSEKLFRLSAYILYIKIKLIKLVFILVNFYSI